MTSRPTITLAAEPSDRLAPLFDGTISVSGAHLNCLPLAAEESFFRMLRFGEFDAAEMSLSSYVLSMDRTDEFIAIPVFPSRSFRHGAVYVRADSDVHDPRDLAGRTVGVPEYQMTAAVWIRGVLQDHHGLPADAVSYRTGGLHAPGREEKIPLTMHRKIDVEPIGGSDTLVQLLLGGGIDALYSARTPRPLAAGDGRLRRLFDDPVRAEKDYAAATGVFPIMHTLVLRREVYTRFPWLARQLMTACEQARDLAWERLHEQGTLTCMLPWLAEHVRETSQIMGDDYWPYGVDANRTTLETFTRYLHQQGLTDGRRSVEGLFAPETLATHVV